MDYRREKKKHSQTPRQTSSTFSPPDVSRSPPTHTPSPPDSSLTLLPPHSHPLTNSQMAFTSHAHSPPDPHDTFSSPEPQDPHSLTFRPQRPTFDLILPSTRYTSRLKTPKTHARAPPHTHETHTFPIQTSSHAQSPPDPQGPCHHYNPTLTVLQLLQT